MIRRAPGLKLVVQTLLYSLKPIGNTVLIAAIFFVMFGILGVQVRQKQFFFFNDFLMLVCLHMYKDFRSFSFRFSRANFITVKETTMWQTRQNASKLAIRLTGKIACIILTT